MQTLSEHSGRRHITVASVTLWALGWMAGVALAIGLSRPWALALGSYRTGIITLAMFAAAALYSLRKRRLGISVRMLRAAAHLPRHLASLADVMDRLETWRLLHITLGVLAILPLCWHLQAGGAASTVELLLESVVILLLASGFAGTLIQDFLPHRMRVVPNFEVRLQEVEEGLHAVYVEAEEAILGHSEPLVQAYLRNIRPLMLSNLPWRTLLWATLTRKDPALRACRFARRAAAALSSDADTYQILIGLAEHKVRLEHNGFNLRLSVGWLRVHIALAIVTFVLIVFHVVGALYFNGL